MQCPYCGQVLVHPLGRGRRRTWCSGRCRMRFRRGLARPLPPTLPPLPAWHHGRFEAYQEAYRGLVNVIITDPPYGRKALPIYAALRCFAETTLAPKGDLLCMCGWEERYEVETLFRSSGLRFMALVAYVLEGGSGQTWRATLDHGWQRHWKCLLWYRQAGDWPRRRRSGTTDVILVPAPTRASMDKARFKWEQNLAGFKLILDKFTNPEDVVCDPCMGSATTLVAALSMHRQRVIGIERERTTFATACDRITAALEGDATPRKETR
jgi:hypothetical protein